jgi:hypothetical protein
LKKLKQPLGLVGVFGGIEKISKKLPAGSGTSCPNF